MSDLNKMPDLDKLFDDLAAISQGDVETLARATRQFAREVTAPTTLMPREGGPPTPVPAPPAERPQAERSAP